jgi:tetratricopeptide (TPR) repeat protein
MSLNRFALIFLILSQGFPAIGQSNIPADVQSHLERGHPEKAIELLESFISNQPEKRPEASFLLAKLLFQKNSSSERVGELLKAVIRVRPNLAEPHYYFGKWACLTGKEQLCISELTNALKLSPENLQASMQIHTLVALAYQNLRNIERANASFKEALLSNRKLKEPSPDAAFLYVEFLMRELKESEAETLLHEILRWSPQFGPAHLEFAKLLSRKGRLTEALAAAHKALQYQWRDQKKLRAVHAFLAKTLHALGREDEAKVHQHWIESNH